VQAEQTFPLASAAPRRNDGVARVLREITGSTHIELDSHTRAIHHARHAGKTRPGERVDEPVERARGELMLEVECWRWIETSHGNRITPPSSAQAFWSSQRYRRMSKASDVANA